MKKLGTPSTGASAVQGRGIGHELMKTYCDELDRQALDGYLETDRVENVAFYRRFGFDIRRA